MVDLARVIVLVQQAMDRFDDPDATLASTLRRWYRIASLRGDVPSMSWLELEGRDFSLKVRGEQQKSFIRTMREQVPPADQAVAQAKFELMLARRRRDETNDVYGGSVEQAEVALAMLREEEAIATRNP